MKAYTFFDRVKDFIWYDRVRDIQYFFAKKWLDKNFGKHEYWGDVISDWRSGYERYEDFKICCKKTSK